MVICMVTNNYTPYSGGVVSAIQTYTYALQQQGHTVYIITLDFGVTDDPWYVLRVPSCLQWSFRENMLSVPWRAYRHVLLYIQSCNPDIVHVHSPFLLGNAGVYAARYCHIPVVFTYHSLYERFVSYVPVPQAMAQNVVLRYVHTFCNTVDTVIAPSTYIYNRLCNNGVHMPIVRMPTPIRPVFLQKRRNATQMPRFILSVGRFQPEKQAHLLLDMLADVRRHMDVRLVLIGFGASYGYLRWYAYTYHGFSQETVIFVVKPTQHELCNWYRLASLFVSASLEAQGLVFAEAFASGVPVIALQGSGADDAVQQSKNGFLVQSMPEMAMYIHYIYSNTALWMQMCSRAYATARLYHPYKRTQELLSLYEAMISHQSKNTYHIAADRV